MTQEQTADGNVRLSAGLGAPRLRDGRFVSRDCPYCGHGSLQPEGPDWRCDGLRDPEHAEQELLACEYQIVGGVIYAPNAR